MRSDAVTPEAIAALLAAAMPSDTLPGRVLDAKVASVLGWERTERTGLRWNDPEGKPAPLPHYSTDLAAAWQIIEHFTAKQIPVQVSWPAPGGWACLLCGLRAVGNGATAQLAICRAVLAANWLMF